MLVVHKYGGTSVGDVERIENVTNRVAKAREAGDDIVVVVSAMSGETNKLIGYAEHFTKEPEKKEVGDGDTETPINAAICLKKDLHVKRFFDVAGGKYHDCEHETAQVGHGV